MKKKLLTLLCVITCIIGLTACGSSKVPTAFEMSKISSAENAAQCALQLTMAVASDAESVSEITSSYNKEELATLFASSMYSSFNVQTEAELGAFDGLLTSYAQMVSDMGGLVSTGDYTSEISGKNIIVTYTMYGVNCDGTVTFTFSNDIFCRLKSGDAQAQTTFAMKMAQAGKNMGTAGLNTLLGMGTVFIMLIVISLIISSFKLIGNANKAKKEEPAKVVEAPVVTEESEELSDDTELVAVIMAAISAYEGNGSTDGYVVRSIKKVNRRI